MPKDGIWLYPNFTCYSKINVDPKVWLFETLEAHDTGLEDDQFLAEVSRGQIPETEVDLEAVILD